MGWLQAEDYKIQLEKEDGLKAHLTGNFYPPIPEKVKTVIVNQFTRYWKRWCTPERLLQRINQALHKNVTGWQLRSLSHFDMFLDQE